MVYFLLLLVYEECININLVLLSGQADVARMLAFGLYLTANVSVYVYVSVLCCGGH